MKFTSLIVTAFIAISTLTTAAQAKDLTNRLGVGYRDSYVTFDLPSIAAFYYPSPDLGVLGSLGVDTQENNSKFALAAGVRRIIFKEDNMNFFMGGQVAMINNEVSSTKDNGFEISATVGGEFFLAGLDSLGFNFETGVGITNVKKTRFRTVGSSFVGGGIVFYF